MSNDSKNDKKRKNLELLTGKPECVYLHNAKLNFRYFTLKEKAGDKNMKDRSRNQSRFVCKEVHGVGIYLIDMDLRIKKLRDALEVSDCETTWKSCCWSTKTRRQ